MLGEIFSDASSAIGTGIVNDDDLQINRAEY